MGTLLLLPVASALWGSAAKSPTIAVGPDKTTELGYGADNIDSF